MSDVFSVFVDSVRGRTAMWKLDDVNILFISFIFWSNESYNTVQTLLIPPEEGFSVTMIYVNI